MKEVVFTHREDARELERLVSEYNRDVLVGVAHKIRGGAQLAGDSALADACRMLEQLVDEEDGSLVYRPQVELVLACLQALEVRLLQELPS
ncbi:Hpt domain-containing protein [Pseudomonas sp. TH31]|uniref:Hpt domain-containing protein n=1 Tax=Pseudomonas sp. TH31 TaxID=2796396 RepID=UPI001913B3D5|nr:Hpt domain-containing protein [Pseudomonas sp. TH31]